MGNSKSTGNIKKRQPRRKRMSLYLMNDDVNSFDNVIYILSNYLPMCNSLRAEQIARLVHKSGECHIHTGFPPEIYILYAQIQKAGLQVKLKLDKK
mgnify:CR=1 FL=1|jgi:ATP-dependent Clp protease adapter protein ClpS